MEENEIKTAEQAEQPKPEELVREDTKHYTPRPRWQIVLAWVALAIFIVGVIVYYINIFTPY